MKPVVIFRHSPTEGPGYFATWLDGRGIPWSLVRLDAGEAVPADPTAFAGLCLMGGPMSVNDDLPWITPLLEFIRRAVDTDTPVIGHCLGGQLMSKALGGRVTRNRVKEIGWGEVRVADNDTARRWFGATREFLAFHWHGETFSLPEGAVPVAASDWCAHQAFVLGRHLAMQCHVEMTPDLITGWCRDWEQEVASLAERTPSVQTPKEILGDMEARLAALHHVADALYARWAEGLPR